MFIPKSVLNFIIFMQTLQSFYSLTIENHYTKSIYNLDESQLNSSHLLNLKDEDVREELHEESTKEQALFDIRFNKLPRKCSRQAFPTNCAEATFCTERSGVYHIRVPQYSNDSFLVECNAHYMGGDWTIIQRRQDGSTNFFLTWAEYKVGFGNLDNEFFIGLDKLYALTNYQEPQELLIIMEKVANEKERYAHYSSFLIGNETEKFVLKQTGRFSGTAGDSLQRHIGYKFSTRDQDNDVYVDNCAQLYMGAWWYDKCHSSNLNGHYGDTEYAKGITWHTLTEYNTSLKFVQMMIRPRRSEFNKV